jgi:hypothetical protein
VGEVHHIVDEQISLKGAHILAERSVIVERMLRLADELETI